jgi:hypothetical protein
MSFLTLLRICAILTLAAVVALLLTGALRTDCPDDWYDTPAMCK